MAWLRNALMPSKPWIALLAPVFHCWYDCWNRPEAWSVTNPLPTSASTRPLSLFSCAIISSRPVLSCVAVRCRSS
jgi:hypothetical protein